MASCQTTRWVSTSPYVKLTVTESSSDGDSAVLSWTLQYIADYAADAGNAREYSVKIGGDTVKTGTYQINGVTGTKTIASGTKEISKGTSAQNVSFSCSFQFNLTWSGSYKGTLTASGSISVAAKTSYKITYSGNGDSTVKNVPATQTKWHGTAIAISNGPTRTGHKFNKWNTAAGGGGTSYNAGASYTANADATLYAQWTANTYTVSYDANGGTGAPSSQTKTHGKTLTLDSKKPTRTNYTFLGWSTSKAATSATYNSGGNFTTNANTTLYAVWKLSYTKPTISNFSASRCTSDGTLAEYGTYALVKFEWSTFIYTPMIVIEWQAETGGAWSSNTIVQSGTSGNVNAIVGDGGFDTETSYTFRVTVDDGTDSQDRYTGMSGLVFPIDFLKGGTATAIGKPAEAFYNKDGNRQCVFDVNWLSRFRNHICAGDKVGHLDGKQGVFISKEGYMHLQRTTAQGYHPYICFLLDDATSPAGQIRVNSVTRNLELLAENDIRINDKLLSEHGDAAFIHQHPTSGVGIGFGVGAGGINRGIYDNNLARWLFRGDGTHTYIGSSYGEFKPYYSAGDTISTRIQTGGYCTNAKAEIRFCVPLCKPVIGNPTITIASVDGFILRCGDKYTHGSSADVRAKPASYGCTYNGGNTLYIVATFTDLTNATNNTAYGIDASISITFS